MKKILCFFLIFFVVCCVGSKKEGKDYILVDTPTGEVVFNFRSEVKRCKQVKVIGEVDKVFKDAKKVILLMDPFEKAEYGLSVYEMYRITHFLGIPTRYAFTQETEEKIAVMSMEDATKDVPIIKLEIGNETLVDVREHGLIVRGKDYQALDSAVCQVGLHLLR
jgi:hypothetical protein